MRILVLLFFFCFLQHFHLGNAENCTYGEYGCDGGTYAVSSTTTSTSSSSTRPPVVSSTPSNNNNTGNSSVWYWGARCSGANEVFMECAFPPDCEPTCEEPHPNMYCRQSCAFSRCHCRLGYVRARGGECVRYENCPCPEPEAVCEGGRNKYGECRCQCGPFERCVIPKACGHCSKNKTQEEVELYPCEGASPCGANLCNYQEQCQYNVSSGEAQCVARNQTAFTEPPSSSSSSSGTPTPVTMTSSSSSISPSSTSSPCPTSSDDYSSSGGMKISIKADEKWPDAADRLKFHNTGSKPICGVTFRLALPAGLKIDSKWNFNPTSNGGIEYMLPDWVRIEPGASFNDAGAIISGDVVNLKPAVGLVRTSNC